MFGESKGPWSRLQDPYDVEAATTEWEFADREIRQGFIRKVFGILSAQLLLTTLMAAVFVMVEPVKLYIAHNPWTMYVAIAVSFGALLAMACIPNAARTFPTNYLLLFLFTLAESYLIGTVCAFSKTEIVLEAAGITAVVCLALTAFAFQTRYDFTTYGGVLCSVGIAFFFAMLLAIFLPHNRTVNIVFAAIGAVLFSCYLVFDIQSMMAGKRMQLTPDDYAFAALNLYLDVINIFIYILTILNNSDRN